MRHDNISDEFLNAFVDNQLDSAEKNQAFNSIDQDNTLKERLCELRGLKEMVRHAYPQQTENIRTRKFGLKPKYAQALAASLLLLTGCALGLFIAGSSEPRNNLQMAQLIQTLNRRDLSQGADKIIIQVSDSNPVRLKAALDETENLLESYKRDHHQLQVEIIANGSGVDLLRSDVSPYANRLALIKAKYPNIDYLVCNQTLNKLLKKGVSVHLLPHTGIAPSAAEQINKRVLRGWEYIRV